MSVLLLLRPPPRPDALATSPDSWTSRGQAAPYPAAHDHGVTARPRPRPAQKLRRCCTCCAGTGHQRSTRAVPVAPTGHYKMWTLGCPAGRTYAHTQTNTQTQTHTAGQGGTHTASRAASSQASNTTILNMRKYTQ